MDGFREDERSRVSSLEPEESEEISRAQSPQEDLSQQRYYAEPTYDRSIGHKTGAFAKHTAYVPLKDWSVNEGAVPEASAPEAQQTLGEPRSKPLISKRDVSLFFTTAIASFAAAFIVFYKGAAIYVGETNQLVIVGLLLSVMAYCTQQQWSRLLLLLEARFGQSTLQNYEAFVRGDLATDKASLAPRLSLAFLLALPLALSVLYKKLLLGGSSVVYIAADDILFATTAPPIYTNAGGLGAALVVNGYMPFWQNPQVNKTYGFNLWVASNETSAMLDAPSPYTLLTLQDTLANGESVTLTATVNATVAEYGPISDEQRQDVNGYWQPMYDDWSIIRTDLNDGYSSQLMVGGGSAYYQTNNTVSYLAVWDLATSSFHDAADMVILSRRSVRGTWNVTQTTVDLIAAGDVSSIVGINQLPIEANLLNLTIFNSIFQDYNWLASPRQNDVNTRIPLIAAMAWGRLATKSGSTGGTPQSTPYEPFDASNTDLPEYDLLSLIEYQKSYATIIMTKQIPTLKRTPWLLVVLIIHPLLMFLGILLKVLLYSVPIHDTFGMIAILSAIDEASLRLLRGGGLSGRLRRPIRVRFDVDQADINIGVGTIRAELDASRRSGMLERRTVYG